MANNGGRQGGGGGGANGAMDQHVEFTVKAEEDLYLCGSENTIRRVTAETNYSCLMLKTQRFSSLFRHYAKYHGLRKDDLEYYFVNPLENEDTPESVQLQRGDTIMVRKRRKPEPPEPAADDEEFFKDMRELLSDEEHMDAIFLVHRSSRTEPDVVTAPMEAHSGTKRRSSGGRPNLDDSMDMETEESPSRAKAVGGKKVDSDSASEKPTSDSFVEIRAHRCVLTARTDYFKALFRKSAGMDGDSTRVAFREGMEGDGVIRVDPHFSDRIVRFMLEFVYTNRIQALKLKPSPVSTDDLLSLLHMSDRYILRDLKRLCEHELIRNHMNVETVARMYCRTDDYNARRLSRACIDFIMNNIREVTGNLSFQEEMKAYPKLCIPILKAAADLIPEPVHKKPRTGDHHGGGPGAGGSGGGAPGPAPGGSGGGAGTGGPSSGSTTPSSNLSGSGAGGGAGSGGGGAGAAASGISSSPVPDSDP